LAKGQLEGERGISIDKWQYPKKKQGLHGPTHNREFPGVV